MDRKWHFDSGDRLLFAIRHGTFIIAFCSRPGHIKNQQGNVACTTKGCFHEDELPFACRHIFT